MHNNHCRLQYLRVCNFCSYYKNDLEITFFVQQASLHVTKLGKLLFLPKTLELLKRFYYLFILIKGYLVACLTTILRYIFLMSILSILNIIICSDIAIYVKCFWGTFTLMVFALKYAVCSKYING